MCRTSIYEARNQFSAMVKRAENGETVELTRHDKPVAVIISWDEYEKTHAKKSFYERWKKTRNDFSDVCTDPSFNGLEISKDEFPDEAYEKKVSEIWG